VIATCLPRIQIAYSSALVLATAARRRSHTAEPAAGPTVSGGATTSTTVTAPARPVLSSLTSASTALELPANKPAQPSSPVYGAAPRSSPCSGRSSPRSFLFVAIRHRHHRYLVFKP